MQNDIFWSIVGMAFDGYIVKEHNPFCSIAKLRMHRFINENYENYEEGTYDLQQFLIENNEEDNYEKCLFCELGYIGRRCCFFLTLDLGWELAEIKWNNWKEKS